MHRINFLLLLILLIVTNTTISCQSVESSDDFQMTVAELVDSIKNDSSLVILDVRMP